MKWEIKLSDKYMLIINLVLVKNYSTNQRSYEISSKIVNIDTYNMDNDCIGKIDSYYTYKIQSYTPTIFKEYRKKIIKKKIKKAISSIVEMSKELVEEWEGNDSVMRSIDRYVDKIKSYEN